MQQIEFHLDHNIVVVDVFKDDTFYYLGTRIMCHAVLWIKGCFSIHEY